MCSKVEIDIDENSLENSADGEILGMVDEGSFESSDDKTRIVSQTYLTHEDPNSQYQLRDISGSITYKIVQMSTTDNFPKNVATNSPTHIVNPEGGEYFVIGNPVEVFGATATQKKPNRREAIEVKAATAKKVKVRDDKRRATHNEVERRRRDKINSWITKLAALVPNSGLPDSASKGGILAKACDHITELTAKQKRLEKLEVENEKLVLEVLRLNQELTELRKENTSMRNQLADNCIVYNHRPKGQKS